MRDETDFEKSAVQLKAIAEPTRLRFLSHLAQTSGSVTAISKAIDADLAKTSHHLVVLRKAGVLQSSSQGRESIYRLAPGIARVTDGILTIEIGGCQFNMPADDRASGNCKSAASNHTAWHERIRE